MNAVVWGKMMDQIVGAFRDEKISLGLLGIVAMLAWYSFAWANEKHEDLVHKSQFEKEIGALTKLMTEHTEEFRIVNASQLIRDLEVQLELAEATGKSESEIIHIGEEIQEAKTYRRCLIDRKPNCQHLKPPE